MGDQGGAPAPQRLAELDTSEPSEPIAKKKEQELRVVLGPISSLSKLQAPQNVKIMEERLRPKGGEPPLLIGFVKPYPDKFYAVFLYPDKASKNWAPFGDPVTTQRGALRFARVYCWIRHEARGDNRVIPVPRTHKGPSGFVRSYGPLCFLLAKGEAWA
jgi:hypothetical protein